jgi:hypothetical protein
MKKALLFATMMMAFFSACLAQTTSIDLNAKYKFTDEQGLSLSRSGNNCVIATPNRTDKNQLWTFEASPDAGYYHLKNVGTQEYVYASTSWDFWNVTFSASLPSDIGKSEFTIDDLGDGYIGLLKKESHDGPNEYLGTTATNDGSPVYGTCKTATDNVKWKMTVITNDMSALDELITEVQKYETDNLSDYMGMASELEDYILSYGSPANTDSASIKACMDSIESEWVVIKQGVFNAQLLKHLMTQCGQILNTTKFSGYDAFQSAFDAAEKVSAAGDTSKSTDYANALKNLTDAKKQYYMTQEASADNPADYTFMIQHPWFCEEAYSPASNSLDDIATAELSGSVINGGGWVNGSTATGGDPGNTYAQNRTCYSTWNCNYSGYLDIHQNLSDLPNGFYTLSCDALTQEGCQNDQHAYATSAIQTVISPYMTLGGWSNGAATDAVWETLNTADNGKVYVSDGKLTIGCRGSRDPNKADGCNGWFIATNFRLTYYGPADVATLKAMLSDKAAVCQAQCDTMLFKGDKAAYQAVINAAKAATDADSISAALMAMNKGQEAATQSITAQGKVLGSAYKNISDSLAAGVYTDVTLRTIMQSAFTNATSLINAEGQTCACADSVISCMNAYLYRYATEYLKAQNAIKAFSQNSSKDAVRNAIASQATTLKSDMVGSAVIDEYVAQIEEALRSATANDVLATGGTDYTGIISNPTCDGNDYYAMDGWNIGHSANTGLSNSTQQYDGDATGRYIDSWTPNVGALLYNAHQTFNNLPNGTYTLKAACRTSGEPGKEGTYLYTIADNDSVNGVQLAPVKRELCNITKASQGLFKAADGSDSLLYVTDSYGSIWEAAAAATNYGTSGSDTDLAIFQTHGSIGYGWHFVEVPAVVKNHKLTIGFTNDSTFTVGYKDIEGNACVPFTGLWLSADNFTLTMTAQGDNADWSPVTAIASPHTSDGGLQVTVAEGRIIANMPCRVYSMNGQMVNARQALPRGCYIVKSERQAVKVAVK